MLHPCCSVHHNMVPKQESKGADFSFGGMRRRARHKIGVFIDGENAQFPLDCGPKVCPMVRHVLDSQAAERRGVRRVREVQECHTVKQAIGVERYCQRDDFTVHVFRGRRGRSDKYLAGRVGHAPVF